MYRNLNKKKRLDCTNGEQNDVKNQLVIFFYLVSVSYKVPLFVIDQTMGRVWFKVTAYVRTSNLSLRALKKLTWMK